MTDSVIPQGEYDPYEAALNEISAVNDPVNSDESETLVAQRLAEAQALATLSVAQELRRIRTLLEDETVGLAGLTAGLGEVRDAILQRGEDT